jgi:AraC-like DNA-binding protein
MIDGWDTLAPLLGHIHTNLDGDLRLETLAHRAGLSPSQLHRLFVTGLHETPKAAVTRLRLARCAFRMAIEDASLLTIALDAGFKNQETFIRAFRRQYGRTPGAYRRWLAEQHGAWRNQRLSEPGRATAGFALSATKVVSLRAMHLACVRHVGPYEEVPCHPNACDSMRPSSCPDLSLRRGPCDTAFCPAATWH